MTTRVDTQTQITNLYADILAKLPDNTTRDISPQDLRDIVTALNDIHQIFVVEIQNWNDGP